MIGASVEVFISFASWLSEVRHILGCARTKENMRRKEFYHLVGQGNFFARPFHMIDPVLALFVGDIETAMRIDNGIEAAALLAVFIWPTEEFTEPQRHPSRVIFSWVAEQRQHDRISQHATIKCLR